MGLDRVGALDTPRSEGSCIRRSLPQSQGRVPSLPVWLFDWCNHTPWMPLPSAYSEPPSRRSNRVAAFQQSRKWDETSAACPGALAALNQRS